ncbi:hypothetical protein [Paractinoplanes atraurantiacus]|uniref:hypothetical protein n=1 Tax=Paractinoplanes atraurantiacus TaxID=1036182 RepID=UPI000BE2AAC8|nr:hypothetical protein [Actinoplanes atraurantiacus]
MEPLSPVAMPTLSTLVAATVFSTTFLTTRVHRENERAVDHALALDALLATARRDQKPLDAEWFDEQRTVFQGARHDRLADLVLGLNVVIASAAAGLAVAFGVESATDWGSPQGWALVALGGVAVLVLGVGGVDVLRARRVLARRLSETTMGQLAVSERAVRRLAAGKSFDRRRLARARAATARAVHTSRGLYGPAHAWRAEVELLALAHPTAPDHLVKAGRWLDRAIAAGPPTAAVLAAKAYVHEEFGAGHLAEGDTGGAAAAFELAAEAWCQSAELHFRASERMTGERGDVYDRQHRPRRPETLAAALDRLPIGTGPALITARLLAQAAAEHPDRGDVAVRALGGWLHRLLRDFGEMPTQLAGRQILDSTTYEPARELVEQVRAEVEEQTRRAREELDRLYESAAQRQRELDRMIAHDRERDETRSAEELARQSRLERGVGSPEDLAWQEQTIAEITSPRTLADVERDSQEMREAKKQAEAGRRRVQERGREVAAAAHRLQRRQAGRATEADLAEDGRLAEELRDT